VILPFRETRLSLYVLGREEGERREEGGKRRRLHPHSFFGRGQSLVRAALRRMGGGEKREGHPRLRWLHSKRPLASTRAGKERKGKEKKKEKGGRGPGRKPL